MEGKTLGLAVGLTGLAVIVVGTLVLYSGEPPPAPEPPQPPPPPEVLMNSVLKYSQPVWMALVETDAKNFKIPAPTLQDLSQPNGYFHELTASRRLKVRTSLETAHLKISLEISKRRASMDGQSFAMEHLVLRIENRTATYLAYRVDTTVTDRAKCSSKGDIPHNSLVLEPRQILLRTECLYRNDESVDVRNVQVIELPPISAYYISRLPPNQTLTDPRTSSGHVPLAGTVCPQTFSWREIQDGIDKKQLGWRDVIDFYARHNCDEYSFFRSYRYRSDPGAPLPARPLD
jgi:hypothetical protein